MTMLVSVQTNLLVMTAGLALMVLLSRNGAAEPITEAIAVLEKGKTAERRQAVLTLARIGDQRAAQPLAKAMHDADRMVRETSAQALWQVWHRSGNVAVDERLQAGIEAMNRRALEEAMEIFTEVIDMAPDFAEGHNKRATVYYMQERYEQSLEDCVKTLDLNPIHFGALSGSGLVYLGLRKPVKALEFFKRAIAVNPNMPSVIQNIEDITRYLRDQTM
jgi:tetratricopeptide (TPR) repeat protein